MVVYVHFMRIMIKIISICILPLKLKMIIPPMTISFWCYRKSPCLDNVTCDVYDRHSERFHISIYLLTCCIETCTPVLNIYSLMGLWSRHVIIHVYPVSFSFSINIYILCLWFPKHMKTPDKHRCSDSERYLDQRQRLTLLPPPPHRSWPDLPGWLKLMTSQLKYLRSMHWKG